MIPIPYADAHRAGGERIDLLLEGLQRAVLAAGDGEAHALDEAGQAVLDLNGGALLADGFAAGMQRHEARA